MNLLPFDLETYKASPERLRHLDGSIPIASGISTDEHYLFGLWSRIPCAYHFNVPLEMSLLRLARLTRKVRCRAYRMGEYGMPDSGVCVATDDFCNLSALPLGGTEWISPEFEKEVLQ